MNSRDEIKLFRDVRILMGWAAAAVPVLLAVATGLWYIADHLHAFAQAQDRIVTVRDAQQSHERDHARQLGSIDRKLDAIEPMIERRIGALELALEKRLGPIEHSPRVRARRRTAQE